jgi:hypothetical protein
MVANQLDAPSDTLDRLFNPMPGGSVLPDGTQFSKYDFSVTGGFDQSTYSGETWLPNGSGSVTFGPGDFGLIQNNADTAFTVTFVGLVRQGQLTRTLQPGINDSIALSSEIPVSGGVNSVLGLSNPFNPGTQIGPLDGDWLYVFNGTGYTGAMYDSDPDDYPPGQFTGFTDGDGHSVPEPQLTVGMGLIFSNLRSWGNSAGQPLVVTQNFNPCAGQ